MEVLIQQVLELLRGVALLAAMTAVITVIEFIMPFFRPRGKNRIGANIGLFIIYFATNIAVTIGSLGFVAYVQTQGFGLLAGVHMPFWQTLIVTVVVLDFFSYLSHVLLHKIPFMWRVHRIHHADVHLDATTAFRTHPMEAMFRFMFTMAPAILLGLPPAAVAIYRTLSGVNAIFEHMNLSLWQPLDTLLSLVYVTPNMHKMHHSRNVKETDTNYSNLFSIYDRLFGTFTPTVRARGVDYGLDNYPGDASLWQLLASPFDFKKRQTPPPAPMALAKATH